MPYSKVINVWNEIKAGKLASILRETTIYKPAHTGCVPLHVGVCQIALCVSPQVLVGLPRSMYGGSHAKEATDVCAMPRLKDTLPLVGACSSVQAVCVCVCVCVCVLVITTM